VHPWQDGPLRGEQFDQDTWLASFEDVLRSGPTAGYARTRFLAQMEWALVDMPAVPMTGLVFGEQPRWHEDRLWLRRESDGSLVTRGDLTGLSDPPAGNELVVNGRGFPCHVQNIGGSWS
jgi:hypothetical protein